jgi:hypothetical protein
MLLSSVVMLLGWALIGISDGGYTLILSGRD